MSERKKKNWIPWEKADYVKELVEIINQESDDAALAEKLSVYHENDIAEAFELLDEAGRRKLYRVLDTEWMSEVFAYLDDVGTYLEELEADDAADIIENMDADDAVDVLQEVDDNVREKLVSLLNEEATEDIQLICSYDEDQMGSMMTTNFIQINRNLTIKQAMKSLVAQAEDNDNISTIYVTDEDGIFYGAIDLKDLIVAREYVPLEELISTSYPYVLANETITDNLERLKDYAEDSIPVLDQEHRIIGVITSQDLVEAVDDEIGEDYAQLAGLTTEEDLGETVTQSMKKRLPWLLILLGLGLVVSTVTGMFEQVLTQLTLIVFFQSTILGMSGNAGTQSLAVTIRVLMDEELTGKERLMLVWKELRVGLCDGLLMGCVSFLCIGLYILFVKGKTPLYAFSVSGCVGMALMVAMTISGLVGTVIPVFFHKINVDPAVASGPLISTVSDLVAVVTYYGLAWVLLLNVIGISG
ncbi:MAG: magnesium transporter [Clostridiales bacterium]|jgi:magnesium transporter|nr:MAG: magnesium transporter [Clostridiales bacterium]